MCDPEVALKNTEYIGYSTPNVEAKKMLDEETLNDKTAYPSDEDIKNCEVFESVQDIVRIYDKNMD